jgi:hypothetical protein
MATSRGSNGALSCRDDHGWRRGRNLCALPLQITNDYSEIGRLKLGGDPTAGSHRCAFQMAAHSPNSWVGYGTGMEAKSDQTRAMYATEDALVARSRLVTTRFG